MDFALLFPAVGSVAVICFILAQIFKSFNTGSKYVPAFVLTCGALLGLLGEIIGIPPFAALNIFDAIATGAISGVASSGLYSMFKNLSAKEN